METNKNSKLKYFELSAKIPRTYTRPFASSVHKKIKKKTNKSILQKPFFKKTSV